MSEHLERSLVSLFTGGGGLDIGLEMAGLHALVVNELQPHACVTLRENRALAQMNSGSFDGWFAKQMTQKCWRSAPLLSQETLQNRLRSRTPRASFLKHAEIVEADIRSLASKQILAFAKAKKGDVFMVAGGPPCQPFSRAGKRESMDVADGRLFLEFVRIVNEIRPRWFLFENVKGLVLTATDIVRGACSVCGDVRLVSFEQRRSYLSGEQQAVSCLKCEVGKITLVAVRQRGGSLDIILKEFESLGYECHHALLNAADFGVPQLRERLIIIGSRDRENFAWPRPTHSNSDLSKILPLFPEKQAAPWVSIREALWRNGHPMYGPLDDRALLWVKNIVRPHDEPVTWRLNRPSPTIGAHQAAKLAIAPDGVPDKQLARQQWHTLGRRQSDLPPVKVEHEYLTDIELLRLQTFPDSWYLHGTRMERAFQIGNAVPVHLASVLGKAVMMASRMTLDLPTRAQKVGSC